MDNKGGKQEAVIGGLESAPERVFGAVEMGSMGGGEMEKVEEPVMSMPETVPVVLPPIIPEVSEISDVGGETGDAPVVGRDAERVPKEYARHVAEVIRKHKKDPNQLQSVFTDLKWDYMRKAFNRDLGDGLDGKGKAA